MSDADVELPSGTITMLFTDIEGSTQLLRELGVRYQIARVHDWCSRPNIAQQSCGAPIRRLDKRVRTDRILPGRETA